ncbi:hypothetical protein HanXRQr2_Chr03g0121151 [Helianthus annuus]|uniref:Secreted protein n=1 Tax=Helianthus annuus TaxID=4232 RepID=A0A251V7Y6_HELAN|nr:hypothetical protein HanXRQr2_Chr03g0121151 [Helianthus annuus]
MMGRKMVKWWTRLCVVICSLPGDCPLKALHDKPLSLSWTEERLGTIAVKLFGYWFRITNSVNSVRLSSSPTKLLLVMSRDLK